MLQRAELTKYFKSTLFIPQLKSKTKDAVLKELLLVLEMLHQREKLGSTGIGKNVAIPHGRTTATSDVIVAFGRSEQGIDFDAIDKKPVHLFFMVIAPPHDEGNVYLPILGSLVTVLNLKKNRDKLLKVNTFEEFIEVITGES